MWSSCLQPITGSDAQEIGSVFPTKFGTVASEIPRNGKTSEAFSDGMFLAPLPIDR